MLEYMDDISEVVYVSDIETHELLYLNACGRRMLGANDVKGRTCYETFRHEPAPCANCTNHLLSFDENYTWEQTSPVTGHRYLLKDRLIEWEGSPARIEIAFDKTATEHDETELKNALDAERLVLGCARQLYREHDVAQAANGMLRSLGTSLDSDRSYIFEYRDGFVENTYEWCAPGVEPEIDRLRRIDAAVLARWQQRFDRGECVIIENLDDEVDPTAPEREILDMLGVKSLAAVPLERDGRAVGFVGVADPPPSKIRNIASLLRTLGYFYLMTVQRIEGEKKLVAMGFRDELTGLFNRNRYLDDMERLKGRPESLGAVFVDVNDLKLTNDRYGHNRGDEALQACASLLASNLPDATLYRIGGDEFVALMPSANREEFEDAVAKLQREFDHKGGPVANSVSVGSSWAADATDVDGLLSAADADMYEKKRRFHLDRALRGGGRALGEGGWRPRHNGRRHGPPRIQRAHGRAACGREQAPA